MLFVHESNLTSKINSNYQSELSVADFESLTPLKFSRKRTYNFGTDTYLTFKTQKSLINQGY